MSQVNDIITDLRKIGFTADKLFDVIRSDLSQGHIATARHHLNFVDRLLETGSLLGDTEYADALNDADEQRADPISNTPEEHEAETRRDTQTGGERR